MNAIDLMLDYTGRIKRYVVKKRAERKWRTLQDLGLRIGKDVYIPFETWIDTSHCYLISIGDKVRFGPHCAILAHDAFMNEDLNMAKIGRVTIHNSCTIGFGSLILPGVEIGEKSIVSACSVVTRSVPPGSVVAGNPAKVIGKTANYLNYHKNFTTKMPLFPYEEYGSHILTSTKRNKLLKTLGSGKSAVGYITGGYSNLVESHEYFSGKGR